ncbi:MAG TPA: DUF3105 domain-containing protein [Solirubrobacteraceae bacterium]|nr:DUF3105 domain-containing protein [Solirubrobacteraceae bacterium]
MAATALAVALGLGAIAGLVSVLGSRDRSTFGSSAGPGQVYRDQGAAHLSIGSRPAQAYSSSPPTSGPHVAVTLTGDGRRLSDDEILSALETGNVVLVYRPAAMQRALRSLAASLGASFSPALAASGQAVVLDHDPRAPRDLLAASWRHLQPAASPTDPALRSFIEFWVGRGAPR